MAFDPTYCPEDAYAVTPHDTNANDGFGFQVGVTGDVSVVTLRGTTVTLPACQAGLQYAIKFTKLRATGTTATSIIAYRG